MSPAYRNARKRTCIWYAHNLRDGDEFSRFCSELFGVFSLRPGLFLFTDDWSKPTRRGKPIQGGIPKAAKERFQDLDFVQAIYSDRYADLRDVGISLSFVRNEKFSALYFSVSRVVAQGVCDFDFYRLMFDAAARFEFVSLGFDYAPDTQSHANVLRPVQYFNGFSALPAGESIPRALYEELVRIKKEGSHLQEVLVEGKLRSVYGHNFLRPLHMERLRAGIGSELVWAGLDIEPARDREAYRWTVAPDKRGDLFRVIGGAGATVYKQYCEF